MGIGEEAKPRRLGTGNTPILFLFLHYHHILLSLSHSAVQRGPSATVFLGRKTLVGVFREAVTRKQLQI